MTFFRERNNLRIEYSGFQKVSDPLRDRIYSICDRYIATGMIGIGQEDFWVPWDTFRHELKLYLGFEDVKHIVDSYDYDYVFEAVELFLNVASQCCNAGRYTEILGDFQKAFELSGSVYCINSLGQINLKIDEELAKNLEEIKAPLSKKPSAYKVFFDAVGNLMGRKDKPKNVVKDVFVAFEDYLKAQTNGKDYGESVLTLQKMGLLAKTQRSLLEKIYAYRSDAFAVGHAGNSKEPDELDCIWFLETVIAQLKFVDRKLA